MTYARIVKNKLERDCEECKSCTEDTIESLKELIYRAEIKIAKVSTKEWGYETWGIGKCSKDYQREAQRLIEYLKPLQRHLKSLLKGYENYLCPIEVSKITQRVKNNLLDVPSGSVKYKDISILEDSEYQPQEVDGRCIPYEAWERAMFIKMPKFEAKVKLKECVKFTYDVKVSLLDDSKCKIVYDTVVNIQESCKTHYDLKVTFNQCKLEYDKLSENKNCDLDLETYSKLRSCSISYEDVNSLVECGVNLYVNQNDKILVKTPNNNTYELENLTSLHKIKI